MWAFWLFVKKGKESDQSLSLVEKDFIKMYFENLGLDLVLAVFLSLFEIAIKPSNYFEIFLKLFIVISWFITVVWILE